MYFKTQGDDYAGFWFFLGAFFLGAFTWHLPRPVFILISASFLVFCLVPAFRLHQKGLRYDQGLSYSVMNYRSGCSNLTIFYIWMPLLCGHLYAWWLTLISIQKGREFAIAKWCRYLEKTAPKPSREMPFDTFYKVWVEPDDSKTKKRK